MNKTHLLQASRWARRVVRSFDCFYEHGLIIVAVGTACGVAAAIAVARSLASLVFGVSVTDPATRCCRCAPHRRHTAGQLHSGASRPPASIHLQALRWE